MRVALKGSSKADRWLLRKSWGECENAYFSQEVQTCGVNGAVRGVNHCWEIWYTFTKNSIVSGRNYVKILLFKQKSRTLFQTVICPSGLFFEKKGKTGANFWHALNRLCIEILIFLRGLILHFIWLPSQIFPQTFDPIQFYVRYTFL